MIVVYICFYGTLAALVGSVIHLGQLSIHGSLQGEQWASLLHFNRPLTRGELLYLGQDRCGRRVYAAAVGPYGKMLRQIVYSFLPLWGLPPEKVLLVDVGREAGLLASLGCLLRSPRLIYVGLHKNYGRLCRLVSGLAQVET
ncbi:MAG: DUF3189 family protein [Moorellaceae bacterium]